MDRTGLRERGRHPDRGSAIGAARTCIYLENQYFSSSVLGATLEGYGYDATTFNKFALIMVWLYIIGWSTYGPEAPATFAPEFKDKIVTVDVEAAKALCIDCPVQAMCLDGALERREPWGVWGGELFLQGVVIPRKRPRGRPRKSEQVAAQAGQNQKDGAAA